MHTYTALSIVAVWLLCAGVGCWVRGSRRHGSKFCPREPLNTTQRISEAL